MRAQPVDTRPIDLRLLAAHCHDETAEVMAYLTQLAEYLEGRNRELLKLLRYKS